MRNSAWRACDSGVKWSLVELEMLCHCSRGSESGEWKSMFSSVRWCVALAIVESGYVSDDTFAHPVVEANVLVGDTDDEDEDDDDDDAATSSPHVFPTSLAHCSPSRSLALPGHMT